MANGACSLYAFLSIANYAKIRNSQSVALRCGLGLHLEGGKGIRKT